MNGLTEFSEKYNLPTVGEILKFVQEFINDFKAKKNLIYTKVSYENFIELVFVANKLEHILHSFSDRELLLIYTWKIPNFYRRSNIPEKLTDMSGLFDTYYIPYFIETLEKLND